MSIKLNSSKTPTGKARKGEVTVRIDGTSIKACFPRAPFPGEKNQVKKATGIPPVKGWEGKASQLKSRLQLELDEGKLAAPGGMFNLKRFNEILVEYKLRPDLKIVPGTSDGQLPPKPQLSLMEVWDIYCEHRKHDLKETTYLQRYQGIYPNFLKSAIEATKSEDPTKIRNWLIENRNLQDVKHLLSQTSEAYQLAIRNRLITHNPYDGMSEGIKEKGCQGKTRDEIEVDNDNDFLNKSKAYTWDEVEIILDYTKNHPTKNKYHNIIKFLFFTGCRQGEAIAFMWFDVNWEKEEIYIRRNFGRDTQKLYNTKTSKGVRQLTRVIPIPKDGELWNLLKSIPQGNDHDYVFKINGTSVRSRNLFKNWKGQEGASNKGIITELIKQGKLTKYLPCYNTRHTFISHQVQDMGINEKVVAYWCGHSELVSQKHYQDIAERASRVKPGYGIPATTTQQVQQQSEIDLLKQQVEELKKLLQDEINKPYHSTIIHPLK